MSVFLSTFINKIDSKGRISVPSSFRIELAAQTFQGIIVFKSYRHQALEACGIDRMTILSKNIDQLALFSEDHDDLASTLLADAVRLPFDSDGRIVLPAALKEHANLDGQAAFVGQGATFQIWRPEDFFKHQEEARKRLRDKKASLKIEREE